MEKVFIFSCKILGKSFEIGIDVIGKDIFYAFSLFVVFFFLNKVVGVIPLWIGFVFVILVSLETSFLESYDGLKGIFFYVKF